MNKERLSKEIKELILWKIEVEIPPNQKLSIGGEGTFSRDQLKEHVEAEDEIGIMFADMQIRFMKDLVSGKITKALAEEILEE